MLGLIEPPQLCTYCSVLEVSATLLAITRRKTTYPINKREIPASGKFTKYSKCSLLVICIFLKCSLLARKIWQLLVLAKINTLLACSQMLANTIRYPSIPNYDSPLGMTSLTISETSVRVSSRFPNARKVMKARGRIKSRSNFEFFTLFCNGFITFSASKISWWRGEVGGKCRAKVHSLQKLMGVCWCLCFKYSNTCY